MSALTRLFGWLMPPRKVDAPAVEPVVAAPLDAPPLFERVERENTLPDLPSGGSFLEPLRPELVVSGHEPPPPDNGRDERDEAGDREPATDHAVSDLPPQPSAPRPTPVRMDQPMQELMAAPLAAGLMAASRRPHSPDDAVALLADVMKVMAGRAAG